VDLDKVNRKNIIIGVLLNIVSTVAFSVIVYFMLQKGEIQQKTAGSDATNFLYVLIAVSVIEILTAIFLRKKMYFGPTIKSKENFQKDFEERAFIVAIVLSAFAVAIAVYGLILFFMTHNPLIFICFAAVSILFFLYIRPKYTLLQDSLARQEQLVDEQRFYNEKDPFSILK